MAVIPNVTGDSLLAAVTALSPTAQDLSLESGGSLLTEGGLPLSLELTGAGFSIGKISFSDSVTVAAGHVISQNPIAGSIAATGSAVDLAISTGPSFSINKLTQKLLLYLHRVFDKNPYSKLALRVRYDGTGLTWSISNGVLALNATGGSGSSHTFGIANFKIGELADFISALPGYSVPYQDTSDYALLSALSLLDSAGDINTSNGDHVYGYTNILYSYLDSNSAEIGAAKVQINNALAQMSTATAQDEWLDYHGGFYKEPRKQGEIDENYAPRIIAGVLRPRGNNVAIATAIQSIAFGAQRAASPDTGFLLDESGGLLLDDSGSPLMLESDGAPIVSVIDSVDNTGIAITYNGLIRHDGTEFYDAGLGSLGAYGFFDVDFSYDFSGAVSQSSYFNIITDTVENFRDAGTHLRTVIFRNNGSTQTVVSDSFIGRIRVIVYDDFASDNFRLLENGSVRLLEDGSARILES